MRSAISIFLTVILVPVTVATLLVTSVKSNVLTSRFLKTELTRQNVYGLATRQIDEQVLKLKIDPQYPITHAEITDIAHAVLTEAWLRQNVEGLLDQFFGWLNQPSGTVLAMTIDLRQPKTELFQRIDGLLAAKLPQLQPCPRSRNSQRTEGLCNFAGMTVPQVKTELARMGFDLTAMQQKLPDTLDVLHPDLSAVFGSSEAKPETTSPTEQFIDGLERAKTIYHEALRYYLDALLVFGWLVVVYLAVNLKGWRRLTRWFGILALSVGLLPLVIGLASRPLLETYVIPNIHFKAGTLPELPTIAVGLIRDVQQAMFVTMLIIGAVLVAVGLAAIIGAHWLPKPVSAKNKK